MIVITDVIIKAFERYLFEAEKSTNTILKYIRDIRSFGAFTKKAELTREMVLAFKNKLLEEGFAPASINSMIASVNCFLIFLGQPDWKLKAMKLQRPVCSSAEQELTKEEYLRLVKTAQKQENRRLSLLLQTLCGTGIRVSELQFITVEAIKRGEARVSLKGKTRQIFLIPELKKKLLHYAAQQKIKCGPIFITRTGKPMNRFQIWKEMKALCRAADVSEKKVFPHNLRHLFARIFYSIDKDIAKLADILGHSSINTTRIYIISTGREHHKLLRQMHLIL